MTLTDFLLARTAENEGAARGLLARVEASQGSYISLGLDHPELAAGDCPGYLGEYDPARVLAECEAKRRIVERLTLGIGQPILGDTSAWLLRQLALSYADHPDYRQEWRP